MKRDRLTPAEERRRAKAAAKRKALRAIRKVTLEAKREGVSLSEWEGDFLGSLAERVATFGRAFADLEKGGPGTALSVLQARKLREIAEKAGRARGDGPQKTDAAKSRRRGGFAPPRRGRGSPRPPRGGSLTD